MHSVPSARRGYWMREVTDFGVDVTVDTSRICGVARHGYVGWRVTDFGWRRSRILDAEVAGSGGADLQGWWWFWARR